DARDRGFESARDAQKLVDDIVGFVAERTGGEGAAPGLVLAVLVARILAAQHPALERRPWGDAEPELARHRHELALDGALEQRVFDLQRDERRPTAKACDGLCLGDLPGRRIREADVA